MDWAEQKRVASIENTCPGVAEGVQQPLERVGKERRFLQIKVLVPAGDLLQPAPIDRNPDREEQDGRSQPQGWPPEPGLPHGASPPDERPTAIRAGRPHSTLRAASRSDPGNSSVPAERVDR